MLDIILRPKLLGLHLGGRPFLNFEWREIGEKRRLIGIPNHPMRRLHHAFGEYLVTLAHRTGKDGWGVRKLPSATAFVAGSNPLRNARHHSSERHFYITDLVRAYESVDIARLAEIITLLIWYEDYADSVSLGRFAEDDRTDLLTQDRVYPTLLRFLEQHFAGPYGRGLAVGGPLSPYLMNLYCEVVIDATLRRFCERREIGYTRFADDLVFSATHLIGPGTRKRIRRILNQGGFLANKEKSRVAQLPLGTVFITKWGLERPGWDSEEPARLVYPQRKRRKLHGLINNYLHLGDVEPERVSGYIAEFIHYYKQARPPTATDQKTFALCQEFQRVWREQGGPRNRIRRRHRR